MMHGRWAAIVAVSVGACAGSEGGDVTTIAGATTTSGVPGTSDGDPGSTTSTGAAGSSGDASTDAGSDSGAMVPGCGPSGGAGGVEGETELPLAGFPSAWRFAPPSTGTALPLVVSLHGSGDDAYNFNYQFLVPAQDTGAFLVVTPEGSNPMGWDPNADEDIVFAAIDEMLAQYDVDTCRIYVAGFSAGAYYSFLLGLQHADVFAGLGSIQGTIEYAESVGVTADSAARKLAVDIHHGTLDGAYAGAEHSRDVLEAAGFPVYFKALPGVSHETSPEYAREIWDNLSQHSLLDDG